MKKFIIMSFVLTTCFMSGNVYAQCSAAFMSSPDDMFGQQFNCSDGSSYTYNQNTIFGDTITNNQTGETLGAGFMSNTSDEYGMWGRSFDNGNESVTINRGGIFGDTLTPDW